MRALITLLFIALYAGNTPAKPLNDTCFGDKNLLNLQDTSKQRGTLIYVWSPRMVYSMQNAALASRAAAAAGLEFVALHDMRISGDELLQARSVSGQPSLSSAADLAAMDLATPPLVSPLDASRPLCAQQLLARDALRHFPTAFVVRNHSIHVHPIVGAMPLGAWVSSIDQRLK